MLNQIVDFDLAYEYQLRQNGGPMLFRVCQPSSHNDFFKERGFWQDEQLGTTNAALAP